MAEHLRLKLEHFVRLSADDRATLSALSRSNVREVRARRDIVREGEDPGAIGPSGTYEKDVTLAIARKLKTLVDAQPNMRGVLTRVQATRVPRNSRSSGRANMRPGSPIEQLKIVGPLTDPTSHGGAAGV